MSEPLVHIARNGQLLEPVEAGKIATLLDTGDLLTSDHYYDERTKAWIHLSRWQTPSVEGVPGSTPRKKRRSRGKNARAEKRNRIAIGGWIACLFAVAIAAGLWAWGENLNSHLKTVESEVADLKQTIISLRQENLALNEMTPSGRVRCLITYEPGKDQVAILSGVTIGLYRRTDVENVLKQHPQMMGGGLEYIDNQLQTIKASLPSPLAVTLSDSNGRADIVVPESGDYVLAASASNASNQRQYLWLAGFQSGNHPSNVILLGEHDAISVNNPEIQIKDVRSFASAKP